ncbi:hypothetical protein I5F56_02340 [Pseudomonas aeruginosa]|nr:hypothetical protein [Pseudomonas aeruginosa]MCS7777249.1 hypothetical protein [Pseudomonas aeruginosa]
MNGKKKAQKKGSRALSTKEKVARLEKQIEELEAALPEASSRRAGSIERQLRLLGEQLRIQKIHLVSKLDSVRHYTVSGSYGTGRRTN